MLSPDPALIAEDATSGETLVTASPFVWSTTCHDCVVLERADRKAEALVRKGTPVAMLPGMVARIREERRFLRRAVLESAALGLVAGGLLALTTRYLPSRPPAGPDFEGDPTPLLLPLTIAGLVYACWCAGRLILIGAAGTRNRTLSLHGQRVGRMRVGDLVRHAAAHGEYAEERFVLPGQEAQQLWRLGETALAGTDDMHRLGRVPS